MSDNTNADGPTTPAQAATTAGALLKAARLAAGVHLAVLSANLKVPVRQLAALEADEYPTDQSPVFARGIAASVCRQLRVDPAPILALLPSSSNYLEPHGAVRYANTGPVDLGTLRRAPFEVPAKAVVAAVVMLLVIAALIWLPSPTQWTGLAGQPEAVAVLAPEASENTSTNANPNPNANPDGPSSLPGTVVLSPSELTPAASDSAQSSVSTAVAAMPELVFIAQNVSWIEVRDAQKQLIWNGVLNAGETKRVATALPVSVVVGRADAIQLSVKGQAFDLKPHTLVNTARFEVKP